MGDKNNKKVILIIDDDEALGRMLRTTLQTEGYDVMYALGVDEAFAYIDHKRPDLVICDIMMPEKDGHDFLKELREKPEITGLKVIMLTALNDLENIRKTVSGGAYDYLTKPIEVPKLLGTIKSALNEYYAW